MRESARSKIGDSRRFATGWWVGACSFTPADLAGAEAIAKTSTLGERKISLSFPLVQGVSYLRRRGLGCSAAIMVVKSS
jgi:hypothetical protein